MRKKNRHYALMKQSDDPVAHSDTSRKGADLDYKDSKRSRGDRDRSWYNDMVRGERISQRKARIDKERAQRASSAVSRHRERKAVRAGDSGFGRMSARAQKAMKK